MKFMQNSLTALALSGLTLAPIAAHAAPAPRVAAAAENGNALHGHIVSAITIVAIFGALLLLAEVTDLIDVFGNDHDHPPVSP